MKGKDFWREAVEDVHEGALRVTVVKKRVERDEGQRAKITRSALKESQSRLRPALMIVPRADPYVATSATASDHSSKYSGPMSTVRWLICCY